MLPMRNDGLAKNFKATAAILPNRIVKFGADQQHVVTAAAAADKSIGVSDLGADAAEDRVDVFLDGIVLVQYGGTVALGDMLTSDATGRAITTTTAGNAVIGRAMHPGVVDDIGSVDLEIGTL